MSRNNEIRRVRMVPPEEAVEQLHFVCPGDALLLTAYLPEWNGEQLLDVLHYGISKRAACMIVFDCASGMSLSPPLLEEAEKEAFPVILVDSTDQPLRVPVTRLYDHIVGGLLLREMRSEFFEVMLCKEEASCSSSMIRRIENTFLIDFGSGCQACSILCLTDQGEYLGEEIKKRVYDAFHHELEQRNIACIDTFRDKSYFAAFPAMADEEVRTLVTGMIESVSAQSELQNLHCYGGIGSPRYGMNELRKSFAEAKLIIRAMKIFDEPGHVRMVPEYHHFMMLLDIRDHKKLINYRNPKLQGLYEMERSGNGQELTRTLEVYLRSGRNSKQTAEKLFIHRNTLHQRLKKIETLCGVDLSDPETAFELQFAVYVEKCLIYG